jgi:hypothetical protein
MRLGIRWWSGQSLIQVHDSRFGTGGGSDHLDRVSTIGLTTYPTTGAALVIGTVLRNVATTQENILSGSEPAEFPGTAGEAD